MQLLDWFSSKPNPEAFNISIGSFLLRSYFSTSNFTLQTVCHEILRFETWFVTKGTTHPLQPQIPSQSSNQIRQLWILRGQKMTKDISNHQTLFSPFLTAARALATFKYFPGNSSYFRHPIRSFGCKQKNATSRLLPARFSSIGAQRQSQFRGHILIYKEQMSVMLLSMFSMV